MRRGEVWTVAGGQDYAGKPRPAVVVQDDVFEATRSVTICFLTTNPADAPLVRLDVQPSSRNGLRDMSRLMVDKITTVPRSKVGSRIGRLSETDMSRLNRALIVFLGLGASPRPRLVRGEGEMT